METATYNAETLWGVAVKGGDSTLTNLVYIHASPTSNSDKIKAPSIAVIGLARLCTMQPSAGLKSLCHYCGKISQSKSFPLVKSEKSSEQGKLHLQEVMGEYPCVKDPCMCMV